MRIWRIVLGLAASICSTLDVATEASATLFSIDNFEVELNGSTIFNDPFDDGQVPPSGPAFINDPTRSPIYTGIRGTFAGESGGKLSYDPAFGDLANSVGSSLPITVTRARLRTATNPSGPTNLGPADTFKVSAVFDLVNPGPKGEDYRIAISENTAAITPNDTLLIGVRRATFNTSDTTLSSFNGLPISSLNGQVVIYFARADAVADQTTFVDAIPVNPTGNPDQIRLSLEKASAGSNEISASFIYMKGGIDLGTSQTFTQTLSIFNGEDFTRPEFGGRQLVGQTPSFAAQLTVGPPASISQTIHPNGSPFSVSFDYKFLSTSGFLEVTLNGVPIGTISAPGTLSDSFMTETFLVNNSSLFTLSDVTLAFMLDGAAGSSILLDDILAPDLANGDFQTGNLLGWNTLSSTAGGVGVADISETPLPAGLPLFLTVLGGLGFLKWRRNRFAAA